jgi:hypothetical protein
MERRQCSLLVCVQPKPVSALHRVQPKTKGVTRLDSTSMVHNEIVDPKAVFPLSSSLTPTPHTENPHGQSSVEGAQTLMHGASKCTVAGTQAQRVWWNNVVGHDLPPFTTNPKGSCLTTRPKVACVRQTIGDCVLTQTIRDCLVSLA